MPFQNVKVIGSNIDPLAYHTVSEKRGAPDFPMSSSALKEFGFCPNRWINGYTAPDSEAKDWGSLFDTIVLTPDFFSKRYVVRPETYPAGPKHEKVRKGEISVGDPLPWNANANYCSEWKDKQGDREIVSPEEYDRVIAARNRLMADPVLAPFIDASDKQVMLVGEWADKDTELVIPVRCLIDLVPRTDTEFYKSLGDLKSTRSALPAAFKRTVFQRGWHVQAALYTDLYVAATKEERLQWCFAVSESYPPWQPGRELLSHAFMDAGRAMYIHWLKLYCQCLKRDFWPSYDDTDEQTTQGWTVCEPEPWMESEVMFAARYEMPTDEAPADEDGPPEITP